MPFADFHNFTWTERTRDSPAESHEAIFNDKEFSEAMAIAAKLLYFFIYLPQIIDKLQIRVWFLNKMPQQLRLRR